MSDSVDIVAELDAWLVRWRSLAADKVIHGVPGDMVQRARDEIVALRAQLVGPLIGLRIKEVRAEALEEAAKLIEAAVNDRPLIPYDNLCAVIRALKDKPHE